MTTETDVNSRIDRIEGKLSALAALLPQLVEVCEEGQEATMKLAEMGTNDAVRQQRRRSMPLDTHLSRDTGKEEAEKRGFLLPRILYEGAKGKKRKIITVRLARATVPTIEQAKSYAEVRIKGLAPEKVVEWFADCRAA